MTNLAKKEANQVVVGQKTCLATCSDKKQKVHRKLNLLFIQSNVLSKNSIMVNRAESKSAETEFAPVVQAKAVIKETTLSAKLASARARL